jgi:hypothetical protein
MDPIFTRYAIYGRGKVLLGTYASDCPRRAFRMAMNAIAVHYRRAGITAPQFTTDPEFWAEAYAA